MGDLHGEGYSGKWGNRWEHTIAGSGNTSVYLVGFCNSRESVEYKVRPTCAAVVQVTQKKGTFEKPNKN